MGKFGDALQEKLQNFGNKAKDAISPEVKTDVNVKLDDSTKKTIFGVLAFIAFIFVVKMFSKKNKR